MTDVIRNHIEIVQGRFGPKVRIAGTRVRVEDVVIFHDQYGWSPEQIAAELPTITLADVYAALAYYLDNREEIDRKIEDDRAFAEEMRRQAGPSRIAEILEERRKAAV